MSRPRLTIRLLMTAVAIAGACAGAWRMRQRSLAYSEAALTHATDEGFYRVADFRL